MNSIQRMQAVLTGAEVDRPPFSFWYNFGLQHMGGEALAQAHIAFAQPVSEMVRCSPSGSTQCQYLAVMKWPSGYL